MSMLDRLPKAPTEVRIQTWLWSVGLFLLGLGAVGAAFLGVGARADAQDTRNIAREAVALASENRDINACRSELASDDTRAQGAITAHLSNSLLQRVSGGTDAQLEANKQTMARLIAEWRTASDRRARATEICGT